MYLESILTDLPVDDKGETRNKDSLNIRKTILNFFKNWDCVALVRPVDDEE